MYLDNLQPLHFNRQLILKVTKKGLDKLTEYY